RADRRRARRPGRGARALRPSSEADRARHEAEVEVELPYNCEHVVPQNWFEKRLPMRGDLHHLFSCEKDCNSFRGNSQYFDFTDCLEVVRERCGKSESPGFEPHEGKARVARATLYFLLRYPVEIDPAVAALGPGWLKTILAWHDAEPVGDFERHRNAAI